MANKYTFALGKRKTATAQIKLYEGTEESTINGKRAGDYITRKDLTDNVFSPLKLCRVKDKMYFTAEVEGSGVSAQSEAVMYGLAKALASNDTTFKKILKSEGLMTVDSRQVERKKPGHHKARKSSQWSKR